MVKKILKVISFLCFIVLTYIGLLIFVANVPNDNAIFGFGFYVIGLIQLSVVEECMM